MKQLIFSFLILISGITATASVPDSVVVPFQRQRFHDKIHEEQRLCDKADGKIDSMVRASSNEEINLQVTYSIFQRVRQMEDYIELEPKVATNNDKIAQLRYIEDLLKTYRSGWKTRTLNPIVAPQLIDHFEQVLHASIDSLSIAPLIEAQPYEIGSITTELFKRHPDYERCKQILFLKYSTLHPDRILSTIAPFVNEPFADSLVVIACRNNPKQLYDYASASNSPVGKLIRRSSHPMVQAVAQLSQTPNALRYYPFLDDILSGKQSIDSIRKYVTDGAEGYDSLGYFRLLVKTAIDYHGRVIRKDTPVALYGVNGLQEMLHTKAIQHFITPINELHEQNNLAIRMKAIEPLSAEELYYMIVLGENDIYTSSYKHSFNRLLQLLGPAPRIDQLLMNVKMDYFKKFIKMAANYNQLDTVLKMMPPENATILMKAFVANLDQGADLEDAVDVADSYSSIRSAELQKNILSYVTENEERSIEKNNPRGKVIYGLLKTIFRSFNDNSVDLTSEIGIPSVYSLDYNYLADDSGRIIQQVFFYGDDDGKKYFPDFRNSFPSSDWKVIPGKEWIEIRSLKGKKVWIFANLPLDADQNLDDSAQVHLNAHLRKRDLTPSVVIHRGHSYWLPGTIRRMDGNAKIILLGSCGGYKNLSEILDVSPDAHIISTKEIGKGDINKPIINYLNQQFVSGKTLVWKDMWTSLSRVFDGDPNRAIRESWDDYVPPYKNLGAIFIKAYNKKMDESGSSGIRD